jgi:hypothetical protein
MMTQFMMRESPGAAASCSRSRRALRTIDLDQAARGERLRHLVIRPQRIVPVIRLRGGWRDRRVEMGAPAATPPAVATAGGVGGLIVEPLPYFEVIAIVFAAI